VSDPVGSGFVTSLPRPGGNITGFTNIEASLGGKWIDLLKEAVPRITRAALMFNPAAAPHWDYYLRPFETAARALAVEPMAAHVGNTEDIERFVTSFIEAPDGGLVVMADVFMALSVNLGLVIALAERYRLPTIYPFRFMTAAGGLMHTELMFPICGDARRHMSIVFLRVRSRLNCRFSSRLSSSS
jgi:putative ABC transport system substrate-binding protein